MKHLQLICGLLMAAGILSCRFESFEERCQREAREYTEKQCPRRMDEYTVMDSVTFDIKNRTLSYFYTMEGVLDSDSVLTPEAIENFREVLGEHLKNSVELKTQKEEGVTFNYSYYSKATGTLRFSVVYDREYYRP